MSEQRFYALKENDKKVTKGLFFRFACDIRIVWCIFKLIEKRKQVFVCFFFKCEQDENGNTFVGKYNLLVVNEFQQKRMEMNGYENYYKKQFVSF